MKVSVQDHSDWFSPNGQIKPRPCPFCQQTRIRHQRAIVETDQGQEKFSYWLVCHDCKSTGPVAGTELQAAQLWGLDADVKMLDVLKKVQETCNKPNPYL